MSSFKSSAPLIFSFLLLIAINSSGCQNHTSCTSFYLHTQRQGSFLNSQVRIPMSKYVRAEDAPSQPGYRLELNFNRAIRAVNIRQVRGRDMSNHRKFIIDTLPKGDEMKIHLSTILRTIWSQNPAITRIILNDQVICGQPLSPQEANQTIVINAVNRKKYHITKPTSASNFATESSFENDEENY